MNTNHNQIEASETKTLLVMAGGTGGHIFPGLAVADELKAMGWNIHWLGTADRMEAKIVPEYGYNISFIDISGLRKKRLLTMLGMPFKLFKSVVQARRVIKAVKPDVVLGMGGYASAPGGFAAWLSNIPLIVHEQNAAAGLSNRLLAHIANKICCAFPGAFDKNVAVEVLGNPLRSSIALQNSPINNDEEKESKSSSKNILVVGGSLGAQVLNEVMPSCFASLVNHDEKFSIWHQTGASKQEQVVKAYAEQNHGRDKVQVNEFIDDMAKAYHWADLVICRAGALTVSELAMAAKPAVFVPLPHAVDDHQTKNALYLVKRDAAKLMPQAQLNKDSIATLISELFEQPETLTNMAKASFSAANSDASKKVAKLCQQLTQVNSAKPSNNEEKI
ncbi:undecaprenyldiphospho-muramoylpentapeptide beta-N-acetylglucosaminyltransferase [Colwellia psychrerythraea]|uniref:UDP-N-acetylglucosamine--N-acetylmuramyl-(pentapeptide) pyrophosphoryl-undecaprenol N-acetylglucosamine transferase n=1 Tax=Colwellia psychrerythraea TaxID=28229 RepID=A0A099KKC3_COLPS|nr:undecaprenyldiphospho-muramoylpentapeptide beta-N-acetylglucosaminyltransferase [Colwellia psychrerythraea]KGJ91254.1 UDP-N-acetylglucosamine--N-acetylmuramyl-(pentapeptide) pyrophosphoryl-undecaprenol N-acetylglucosamine transferase [Colwellia psychrerythraea]